MGFDAVWISPTSRNIDLQTPYNFAYHGYWVNDPTQLNPRFGDEGDLMALSDELHKRNMYFMVDIAVNNIVSMSNDTYLSHDALVADNAFWDQPEYYHPECIIDYSNITSEQFCWIGADSMLPLMDVNTEHPYVQTTLQTWISGFVSQFKIDGLRIDAAKHVPGEFWPGFCKASGVFCIGEVYEPEVKLPAEFQSKNWMDSVLGFPLYFSMQKAFSQIEATQNMSAFISTVQDTIQQFPHPEYLGNFLENHDVPRIRNITADPRMVQNAMVVQFLFDGIPVVYNGQELDTTFGSHDPYNRAALWTMDNAYGNTTTSQMMYRLNSIRKKMIDLNLGWNGASYMDSRSDIIAYTENDVAIRKGPIIMVLTNRGSPEQAASFGIPSTGWARNQAVVDLLTCSEFATGAGGSISVSYSKQGYGGLPYVFMLVDDARQLGICSNSQLGILSANETATVPNAAASTAPFVSVTLLGAISLILSSLL